MSFIEYCGTAGRPRGEIWITSRRNAMRSKRLRVALSIVAACVMTMLAAESVQGQTYGVLYSFTGGSDGAYPNAVIKDAKGNIYGTTSAGGSGSACEMGCGTVFKLSSNGKETVLYSFKGGADGASPYAGVIQDAQGNLYGTTYYGGDIACPGGCGTVFKLSKTGKETILYRFKGGANGENPITGVIQDVEGSLYGTSILGGDTTCVGGCGTVFKLNKTGKLTVLHRFTGGADGYGPDAVILDAKGNLYGTAGFGGDLSCGQSVGCGTVFKLSKTGMFAVLYTFTGGADGANPNSGVILDRQGNLYGTTYDGGRSACNSGCGTVFKLSARGRQAILYSFQGPPDGLGPEGGVARDADGSFYGTTYRGGYVSCADNEQCGTVFEVSKTGKESVLYRFCSAYLCADGTEPIAGVIQDSNGNLYGTTAFGGDLDCGVEDSGCGVVFRLTP
jgi:uncharacterized repeat protein (TIGR03803 family)